MKTSNSSTVDGPIYRSPQWPPHKWPNLKGHPHITHSAIRLSWMIAFANSSTAWAAADQAAWNSWAITGLISPITGRKHPTSGFTAFMSWNARYNALTGSNYTSAPLGGGDWNISLPTAAIVDPTNVLWLYYPPPTAVGFVIPWITQNAQGPIWSGGLWPPHTRKSPYQTYSNPAAGWHIIEGGWMLGQGVKNPWVVLQQLGTGIPQVPSVAIPIRYAAAPA